MRVMNHNWSATKQPLYLQSVAGISRHSVLSGDRIQQCETSPGSLSEDDETESRLCTQLPASSGAGCDVYLRHKRHAGSPELFGINGR